MLPRGTALTENMESSIMKENEHPRDFLYSSVCIDSLIQGGHM